MRQNIVYFLLIASLITGCGIFKGKKEPKEIDFVFNQNGNINYGYGFDFDTYLIYTNGKTKKISSKDELKIEIEGAKYRNGYVEIASYPSSFQKDTIKIKATYTSEEFTTSKSVTIPFNYKGDLKLNFKGEKGSKGEKGDNKGTSLIFGWGKDGDTGSAGYDGYNGNDLTIHVWKDQGSDLYYIKVTDLVSNQSYFFKTKDQGYGIKVSVNGGQGGNGGNGGDGGDGRDGKVKKDKKKSPGRGGNGGIGGDGGLGGSGGSVYIFIHPNAAVLQSKFAVYNAGGAGGIGGKGGDAGDGGDPLEGQTAGEGGSDGRNGINGQQGQHGEAYQILIEEFDIEY